jgi:hypothetical protein
MFAPDAPLRADPEGQVFGQIGQFPTGPGTVTKPVPFQVRPSAKDCDPSIAQTPHLGAMPVAMADGSIHIVSGSVSQYTFWAACTPDSRDEIGPDW